MPLAIVLILALAFSRILPAQVISVSVQDSSGQPIPQVSLALLDSTGKVRIITQTNTRGLAHWARPDTGRFRVLARRFGFRPHRTDLLRLEPTDTTTVRITLERAATLMDPVLVAAQRDTVRQSTVFGINLKAAGGYVITPVEVDRVSMGARDVADMLQRQAVPGVRIDQSRRCLMARLASRCLPFVIDGQLYPDGTALQDVIVPEVIDYMVFLRGTEAGVRWGSIGQNGILLIATRRDWRRR